MNPTSDVYPMTDPLGPEDQQDTGDMSRSRRQSTQFTEGEREESQPAQPTMLNLPGPLDNRAPGSTHSRGSGTADSPIPVDDNLDGARDLGGTRRLLFPSPRKDGVPKVLGELAVNIVQTAPKFQDVKPAIAGKEKVTQVPARATTPSPPDDDDLDQELFGTPPVRPSTPPPQSAHAGPFKTPTRPTPSHRPITRSISRSIRSAKSGARSSPSQVLLQLQRTPSKTPRSVSGGGAVNFSFGLNFSASKRRTPRPNSVHAHFALEAGDAPCESPFTATINQLLSEANEFTSGSPAHGLGDMDLSSLPNLHSDDVMQQLADAANCQQLDFGSFLSAEMGLPSSPPVFRGGRHENQHSFAGVDEVGMAEMWAKLSAATSADGAADKD